MVHCDRDVTVICGRIKSEVVSNRSLGMGDHAAERSYDQIQENFKIQLEMQTFNKALCLT